MIPFIILSNPQSQCKLYLCLAFQFFFHKLLLKSFANAASYQFLFSPRFLSPGPQAPSGSCSNPLRGLLGTRRSNFLGLCLTFFWHYRTSVRCHFFSNHLVTGYPPASILLQAYSPLVNALLATGCQNQLSSLNDKSAGQELDFYGAKDSQRD